MAIKEDGFAKGNFKIMETSKTTKDTTNKQARQSETVERREKDKKEKMRDNVQNHKKATQTNKPNEQYRGITKKTSTTKRY